jgi:Na+-translocating ferredoxin:NAD+ oxidoreductase RNF subunit RnfB
MAHKTSKNYQNLQKRLELSTQGAPTSDTLFKILEILFTEKEAKLVSVLPLNTFTAKKAAKLWKKSNEESKKILDTLAGKGILLDIARDNEQTYVLAPTMAGFFEFSLMRTDGKFDRKILGELFYQYINVEDDFAKELFSMDPAIDRVFIQEQTIKSQDQPVVLDYEKASHVINTAECITVGTCYCRHKMEHVGKACDKPQEVCLTFNNSAKSLAKHGIAKEISKEKALEILNQCIDNGLVQIGDNIQDNVNWMCNCCGCCCEALLAIKQLGHRNIRSNFAAQINQTCTGCGICVQKCPVDAIKMVDQNNKRIAQVIPENCIGCGVCAKACPTKSIAMERFENTKFVPKDTFERFVINAIDRNKLQNFIFDNHGLWTYDLLRRLLKTILGLKPVKRKLAQQQLRSKFLNTLTKSKRYSHPEFKNNK